MKTNKKNRCSGFSFAEMIIALAITAILITGIAVAFNAFVINYTQNDDSFKALNSARQAMLRITAQLRTADAVDPNSPDNECSLITPTGDSITFRFSNTDNKLYLDTDGSSYTLCPNVTAMKFTKSTATEDGVTYVKNVQSTITVSIGTANETLAAGTVIRRNLK